MKIVIDASVARSAGDASQAPVSRNCRTFLDQMRDLGYYVVMTENINAEWKKHASRYAKTWLTSMISRRQFAYVKESEVEDLRISMREHVEYAYSHVDEKSIRNKYEAVEKDVHLVEAAIKCDKIIISNDDTIRKIFASLCDNIPEIQSILWLNASLECEIAVEWMQGGCKIEEKFLLSQYVKS